MRKQWIPGHSLGGGGVGVWPGYEANAIRMSVTISIPQSFLLYGIVFIMQIAYVSFAKLKCIGKCSNTL